MSDQKEAGFPFPDDLRKKACLHCVPIFLARDGILQRPNPHDNNATLTIVDCDGRLFGVTCQHVVEQLKRRQSNRPGDMTHIFLVVGVKATFEIHPDAFFQPSGSPRIPDIAITELTAAQVAAIEKEPLSVSSMKMTLPEVTHAFAFGFPDKSKFVDKEKRQVVMRCVMALAENRTLSVDRETFQIFSSLQEQSPVDSFSGMSGGPLYWTNDTNYGLVGITYEALPANPAEGQGGLVAGPRVHIYGIVVTESIFRRWVSEYDSQKSQKK